MRNVRIIIIFVLMVVLAWVFAWLQAPESRGLLEFSVLVAIWVNTFLLLAKPYKVN